MTRSGSRLLVHDGPETRKGPTGAVVVTVDAVLRGELPEPRTWQQVTIDVSDITGLYGLMGAVGEIGSTARMEWLVGGFVPISLLNGPGGLIDGRNVLEVQRRQRPERTRLFVQLGWPVPVSTMLKACVRRAARPSRSDFGRERLVVSPEVARGVSGLSPTVTVWNSEAAGEGDEDNPGPKPLGDTYLGPQEAPPTVAHRSVIEVRQGGSAPWADIASVEDVRCSPADLVVDTRIVNPVGVKAKPTVAELRAVWMPRGGRRVLLAEGRALTSTRPDRLEYRAIEALRGVRAVIESPLSHPGPVERARFLVECAAAGIPTVSEHLDAATRSLLDPELATLLSSRGLADLDGQQPREFQIALGVRLAHRKYSLRNLLAAAGAGSVVESLPEVAVVLATMRPDFLPHALEQVRAQSGVRVELLLGMHGFDVDAVSPEALRTAEEIGARLVPFGSDTIFGDVLERLSNMAESPYIAKMDDDDWYAEHHLLDLVHAHEYSGATLVGSGVQFVYMNHADVTIRRSVDQAYRFGGHPGGPTMMITRDDLRDVGGWSRVVRAVDTDLNRRVVDAGGTVYQAGPLNFLFNRRSSGHTWKASNEYFYRLARQTWIGRVAPAGFSPARAAAIAAVPVDPHTAGFPRIAGRRDFAPRTRTRVLYH